MKVIIESKNCLILDITLDQNVLIIQQSAIMCKRVPYYFSASKYLTQDDSIYEAYM